MHQVTQGEAKVDPNTSAPEGDRTSVILKLVGLEALENPELLGSAEWTLRLWINGLERWQSPKLRVDRGQTVPIDAEIETQIHGYTEILEVEIQAREHDLLSPDDHAGGRIQLYRSHGFQLPSPDEFLLEGKGARLRMHVQVDVRQ